MNRNDFVTKTGVEPKNVEFSNDGYPLLLDLSSLQLESTILQQFLSVNNDYLQNLQTLNLQQNYLTELPEEIGKLFHLKILNLSENLLQQLPDAIGLLSNLTSLNVKHNQLSHLPDSIGLLSNIMELEIAYNQLQRLPETIGSLSNLISLDARYNQMQQLPETIGRLFYLKDLYIDYNQLQQLPNTIGSLVHLEYLSLNHNALLQLPEEIISLCNLKMINIQDNLFELLPATICQLFNLESLLLDGNSLQQLPDDIGQLIHLKYLSVKNNRLQLLPWQIERLKNLEILDVSQNNLTQLPEHVEKLAHLLKLDLSNNQLTKLPTQIVSLTHLRWLNLNDNPLPRKILMQTQKILPCVKTAKKFNRKVPQKCNRRVGQSTNIRAQLLFTIVFMLFGMLFPSWKLIQNHIVGSSQSLQNKKTMRNNVQLFPSSSLKTPLKTSPSNDILLFRGKYPTLSWIDGKECRQGVQAYLRTANTNPDAALVGSGWINPINGDLVQGQNNNCVPDSLSMDSVVKLIHRKRGMAYITITMAVPGSWTAGQQTRYIARAATHQSYINSIVQEVKRLNYDGVIMDLEGTYANAPSIGQYFATYNQRIWAALKPLHKKYGIALIHKLSDHDAYYSINGFENWRLLGYSADFIVIMAVDQSYFTPGPTVSVPWLKQLLAYTLKTMPQMLPYIIWELPFYGATWRLENDNWVFNRGINDKVAQNLIANISTAQVDRTKSDLNDPTSVHLTYTDSTGIKRTIWYPSGKNLVYIVTEFRKILKQTPQFKNGHLAIAVWYRAYWEPDDFWSPMNAALLP